MVLAGGALGGGAGGGADEQGVAARGAREPVDVLGRGVGVAEHAGAVAGAVGADHVQLAAAGVLLASGVLEAERDVRADQGQRAGAPSASPGSE